MVLHALQCVVGFLVVTEGLGFFVERHLLAEAVGGVGQVAEGGRVVAFENVGVEIAGLAGAYGLDEIAEVIAAARAAFQFAGGQRLGFGFALGNKFRPLDRAGLEMIDISDLLVVIFAGLQAANFEDELGIAVIKKCDLRVGRLAL